MADFVLSRIAYRLLLIAYCLFPVAYCLSLVPLFDRSKAVFLRLADS